MKWRRLGKIFDPTEHELANNCKEFAQSPQALILGDRVRVYFSTRERDPSGKYLSHVAFVDFSRDFGRTLGISHATVIELGGLGCFDEHGIFPMNVVKHGGRLLAYTTGWSRRVSVSADASIGLAISEDGGDTFRKHGTGPVLTSSLHEPFLVGDAFVNVYNGTYHMWYIFGTKWMANGRDTRPERVYKIGHATSDDGVNWRKEGRHLIRDRLGGDECQALPTVIRIGDRYHMVFCYRWVYDFRTNKANAYKLGYAYSDDLNNWTRDDSQLGWTVEEHGWDAEMQCYPHLCEVDRRIYLLYNGNDFGRRGFGLAVMSE